MKALDYLKSKNCEVFITHRRYYGNLLLGKVEARALKARNLLSEEVSQSGGLTTIRILFPDGKVKEGCALCSRADVFSRHHGVNLALQNLNDVEIKHRGNRVNYKFSKTIGISITDGPDLNAFKPSDKLFGAMEKYSLDNEVALDAISTGGGVFTGVLPKETQERQDWNISLDFTNINAVIKEFINVENKSRKELEANKKAAARKELHKAAQNLKKVLGGQNDEN